MECTQRLECTQDLYDTHSERICPEQVGFLGICGAKHPVLKGPNKIGRDPQTCSIVLNLSSVSRQHAVINVLNSREYMLMDLDSANKTKLLNTTLQPYIPHPLKDGDTVQFGDIFGIFRLLEDDNELPMTQAIDIPETPLPNKNVSKLHKAPTTMIPESPDVSDRDDSCTTPSHSKNARLSNDSYIKPFGKTISIYPVRSQKTGSSRNSSKQSTSINLNDNPNTSLNESFISLKVDKNVTNSIYEMDTQAPNPIVNDSTDSIYTADTQIPPERVPSPSIHSLDTQLPTTVEHLPQVHKINNRHEMQFDIYASNKENNKDIFNADRQQFAYEKHDSIESMSKNKSNMTDKTMSNNSKVVSKDNVNTSEEELLFDEVDSEFFEEDFNSQNILPEQLPLEEHKVVIKENLSSIKENRNRSDGSSHCADIHLIPTQKVTELSAKVNKEQPKLEVVISKDSKTGEIESDSSTDCEDIDMIPTQKIPELGKQNDEKDGTKINPVKRLNRIQSDSSTDCEDMILTQKIPEKKSNEDDDVTDCEDDVIQISTNQPSKPKSAWVTKFEDIPTQVIDVDPNIEGQIAFEDMPTQILEVDEAATNSKEVAFEDQPTQIIEEVENNNKRVKESLEDIVSPFKIPLQSPIRVKSKDIPKLTPRDKSGNSKTAVVDDHNYYNATQDIYDDLSSQRETSPDILVMAPNTEDEVVPCSVEDYKVGEKFANIDRDISATKFQDDKQVTDFVNNLSSQDVREVIGANTQVAKLIKVPSDSSDVESTPKKNKPFIFTDSDLPNSQEIKTNVTSHVRSEVTESSSESEIENNTEDQGTPFIHRKKKSKPVTKIDLTKKFEIEKLPERVITRQRKPTSKLQESSEMNKKLSVSMLKPSYWMGQEDEIDGDIITENIKRLKTYENAKNSKDHKNDQHIKEDGKKIEVMKGNEGQVLVDVNKDNGDTKLEVKKEKESTTRNKTKSKTSERKEKIKVKIERPKRADAKSKSESSARTSDTAEKRSKKDNQDSTSSSRTSGRRTRSKAQENNSITTEKKSVSPESKKEDSKRKRTYKRREKSKSPEVVGVRRSKRQGKVNDKNDEDTMKAPKSILKKSMHEQSTVYNMSDSSSESPRSLKRSLVDCDMPQLKRTRSAANNSNTSNNSSINNASLRATPARAHKTHNVLLTAFPSDEVKQKLQKLGAVIVSDVLDCSVVLTMQIKRTFKLLCAVGLGQPIVGPSWVQACVDTHMIVDPWKYLVKDESSEKRFQFNLEQTLTGKRNFLKGFCVSSTPSVQPNASEMKLIVECSGGTWKEGGSNWVCISTIKDKGLWPALRKRGATVVSTEFILGGVMRQKPDIASNKFD